MGGAERGGRARGIQALDSFPHGTQASESRQNIRVDCQDSSVRRCLGSGAVITPLVGDDQGASWCEIPDEFGAVIEPCVGQFIAPFVVDPRVCLPCPMRQM